MVDVMAELEHTSEQSQQNIMIIYFVLCASICSLNGIALMRCSIIIVVNAHHNHFIAFMGRC